MGLPNLDYTALATELLPVPRRQPLFKQVMAAFMKSTSWLYDRFYNYLHGATIDVWDVGTTYNAFDLVYWNFKIYVCLVDGTVGIDPSTALFTVNNDYSVTLDFVIPTNIPVYSPEYWTCAGFGNPAGHPILQQRVWLSFSSASGGSTD